MTLKDYLLKELGRDYSETSDCFKQFIKVFEEINDKDNKEIARAMITMAANIGFNFAIDTISANEYHVLMHYLYRRAHE